MMKLVGWCSPTGVFIFLSEIMLDFLRDLLAPNRPRLMIKADNAFSIKTPLVPANSVAGRSLVMVIAIMTFLAALTAGAANDIALNNG